MEQIIRKDSQNNDIHLYLYRATQEPIKGVVQIVHGASEHFARYGLFADFLNKNGYHVIGSDILGHGLSTTTHDYVHFSDKKGDQIALESVIMVKDYITELLPELPVYLLGHSMGSFIARYLLIKHPSFYNKAVISGTTQTPSAVVHGGMALCRIIRFFKGSKYVSSMIQKMAIDANPTRMFKDGLIKERKEEWLTKNIDIQNYYASSPMCGQPFTVTANADMFKWMLFVDQTKNIRQGHLDCPIFFISGKNDPLSHYGKAVLALSDRFKAVGYRHIQTKLYDNDRHEVLNEMDNAKVYRDILNFFES